MKEELRLYPKKSKLVFGAVALVVMCIVQIVLLIDGPMRTSVFPIFRDPVSYYAFMAVGLALWLYLLRFVVNSLRHPRPRVILSGEGVVVDGFAGRFSAGWEEFDGYVSKDSRVYVPRLKDAKAFADRQAAGRPRETARVLAQKFGSPFLIEMHLLEGDGQAVAAFLARHLREVKA